MAQARTMYLPLVFMFLSLIGGLGIYALEKLNANVFVTEYGGVVIDHEEAKKLREQGLGTHCRTLVRGSKGCVLDGRVQKPCDAQYMALHHKVHVFEIGFHSSLLMFFSKTPRHNC